MSDLGIVAALTVEARCLAGVCPAGTVRVCGVGPRRAKAAAAALLEGGARALLSWGTAGGLEPGLAAGTLCLPAAVVGPEDARLPADAGWRMRLGSAVPEGVPVCEGLLASGEGVLATPADKRALRARTGAAAVDAESAAVAQAARDAGVPFLAVRAVVDPADAGLPRAAVAAVTQSGRVHPGRLLLALLDRPGDLRSLAETASRFRAARRTLAAVARAAAGDAFHVCGSGRG